MSSKLKLHRLVCEICSVKQVLASVVYEKSHDEFVQSRKVDYRKSLARITVTRAIREGREESGNTDDYRKERGKSISYWKS